MNDFTPFEVNGLGGSVIGSGLCRKLCILCSIEGTHRSFWLKTSERCCMCASAFSLSFIVTYFISFLNGNVIVGTYGFYVY